MLNNVSIRCSECPGWRFSLRGPTELSGCAEVGGVEQEWRLRQGPTPPTPTPTSTLMFAGLTVLIVDQLQTSAPSTTGAATRAQTATRRRPRSTAPVASVTTETAMSVSPSTGNPPPPPQVLLRTLQLIPSSLSDAWRKLTAAAATLPPASLLVLLVNTCFCLPSSAGRSWPVPSWLTTSL